MRELSAGGLKRAIQAKLRKLAIERDKSCVVGQHLDLLPGTWHYCGPTKKKGGGLVVQAEHLVGRANSASYGDMDNIILLCKRHHFYFKQQCGALYWEIVRQHIGKKRWDKVQAWEKDKKPHRIYRKDWEDILTGLTI